MAKFTLVYYELNRIERHMEAETMEEAIAAGEHLRHDQPLWEGCDEVSFGTNGVELVLDSNGSVILDAGTVHGMVGQVLDSVHTPVVLIDAEEQTDIMPDQECPF